MKKNVFIFGLSLIFIFCASNNQVNYGFVQYIADNKNKIYLYIVNEDASENFSKNFGVYGENIFNEDGSLHVFYHIPDGNKLFKVTHFNNSFEEIFLRYIVLHDEATHIGLNISKIESIKINDNILVTCFLDSEGSKIFKEFTSNNIGNFIAIVINGKIIALALVLFPLENTINFNINY